MYIIDQNSKIPLHLQLYNGLKNDIITNLQIGDKINSIRKIASLYNISKNTVESAYSQLVAEGYIDSYPKSGYIVTDTDYHNFNTRKIETNNTQEKQKNYLYDFHPARLEKNSFPLKLWKRIFTKVINDSLDFGSYTDPQGEYSLREEISKYLIISRRVRCTPNQIIISNGFLDSMQLLANMLHHSHQSFAMEEPGYHVAYKVFDGYGYNINKIKLDVNGIKIEDLKKSNSKLVYITPSHQYPTGVAIPISRRLELLNWAKENNAFIIEDDYDSELSYENRPIPSLQGLDKFDRVIYVGTFSKSLSPAIRISYMVLPQILMKLYKKNYHQYDSSVALMTQKILESFIKEGYWDRHVRKIRTLNKKKHNLMKSLLIEKLGNTFKIETQGGGLAILINPTISFDFVNLKNLALAHNIKLHFAKNKSGGNWDAIRMGFGGLSLNEIPNAIDIFSYIWYKCILTI
jgi:GntR family transcriptional regulator/MocR family aminotransferase